MKTLSESGAERNQRDATAQLRQLSNLLRQGLHKLAYQTVGRFPYGVWRTASGRMVVFDREYHPLWQRDRNGVSAADPHEWVEDIVATEYFFFDDNPPPYQQYDAMKRLGALVLEWDRGRA